MCEPQSRMKFGRHFTNTGKVWRGLRTHQTQSGVGAEGAGEKGGHDFQSRRHPILLFVPYSA